ncbi:MAG: N-acetylmuramoyl-L-alanine amidase [Syntrophomonadaceae bacterium]|nr:N-acetylmuramoyl-L-alanine amidase [Syntrophomonadaceae bacterium]
MKHLCKSSRYITSIVLLLLVFSLALPSAWPNQQLKIIIDGAPVSSDVPPYIDGNSRTMVPVRFVATALGSQVVWDEINQRVLVTRDNISVELWINQRQAKVNGNDRMLDTEAVIRDGRTMVPLRFLAETFGLKVSWDDKNHTVVIASPSVPAVVISPKIATVTSNVVNVRTGPDTSFPRLTQVALGARLPVIGQAGDWFEVELSGNRKGWIAGWLVEVRELSNTAGRGADSANSPLPPLIRKVLVMGNTVNIRSSPGLDFPVITQVAYGQWLEVLDARDNWYRVQLPDGTNGWIASWFVALKYSPAGATPSDNSGFARVIGSWGTGSTPGQANEHNSVMLTGVHVEQRDKGVIITVAGNGPVMTPGVLRLQNPARLVFDFPAVLMGEAKLPEISVDQSPVTQIRVAQFAADTVRVALDLQEAVSYSIEPSSDGMIYKIEVNPPNSSGRTIVIDPGHGTIHPWQGSDPGAIGPTGVKERDVVMVISQMLGDILLRDGFHVIYTRKGDTNLSLPERAQVANETKADLLVSVHANASPSSSISGTMTFFHAPNGAELEAQVSARRTLATLIHNELLNLLQRADMGVREANFAVLRNCQVPAVLAEIAFISNREEERLLADPAFQSMAAQAIANGIKRYISMR